MLATRHSYVVRRAWLALFSAMLILPVSGCTSDERPSAEPSASDDVQDSEAVTGDAAVWSLRKDARPTAATTSLWVNVQRLACNSGVTGRVLEPSVEYTDSQLVVTFEVERDADNSGDCQATALVPYEVKLSEPIGDRRIIDGACLPEGEATTTSFCRSEGVRWPR